MDLRIERTYKLLTDSLTELPTEKVFEDITVSENCERTMARRATFYKHFATNTSFMPLLSVSSGINSGKRTQPIMTGI